MRMAQWIIHFRNGLLLVYNPIVNALLVSQLDSPVVYAVNWESISPFVILKCALWKQFTCDDLISSSTFTIHLQTATHHNKKRQNKESWNKRAWNKKIYESQHHRETTEKDNTTLLVLTLKVKTTEAKTLAGGMLLGHLWGKSHCCRNLPTICQNIISAGALWWSKSYFSGWVKESYSNTTPLSCQIAGYSPITRTFWLKLRSNSSDTNLITAEEKSLLRILRGYSSV